MGEGSARTGPTRGARALIALGVLVALALGAWSIGGRLDTAPGADEEETAAAATPRHELPAVRHVPAAPKAPRSRILVLNVLADRRLFLLGVAWPLAPRGSEAAQGTAQVVVRQFELLHLPGRSPPALRLHADRAAPWRDVAHLVDLLRRSPASIDRLSWSVRQHAALPDASVHAAFRTGSGEAKPASGPVLALLPAGVDGQLRLTLAGRTWTLPAAALSAVPGRLPEVWEAPAAWAESTLRGQRAVLAVDPEARGIVWGDVVHALDVLLGAGVREVTLPEGGWHLTFADPAPGIWERPGGGWLGVSWVLAGVLAAVGLAFAATLAPHRRGRR